MHSIHYNSGYGDVGAYPVTLTNNVLEVRMAARLIPEYPKSNQPPKTITCTDGTEVLVDADDYPMLSRHGWYINWSGDKPYCITKLKTDQSSIWRCIFIHHLILGTAAEIDHKDSNPLNNQKHNLRPATRQENGWNQVKRQITCTGKPPSSQYKGVSKYANTKGEDLWRIIIKLTKKNEVPAKFFRRNGFKTEVEAAIYYNEEIVKLRGRWAWINQIPLSNSEGGQS